MSSLATDSLGPRWPRAVLEGEREKERKRISFTSIAMLHTHTPGQSRVNPERQEEEKADTDDGQKANTAQGGRERTDLQNQPTRRNGPDRNRAHT